MVKNQRWHELDNVTKHRGIMLKQWKNELGIALHVNTKKGKTWVL